MGYRSEVAIRCQSKAYEKFKEVLEKTDAHPDKLIEKNGEYLLYFDWWKWYSDFEEVKGIEAVMDELDELDDGCNADETYEKELGYHFIRLGEDNDDVETRCNCWHVELYMIRKIDISDFEEVV